MRPGALFDLCDDVIRYLPRTDEHLVDANMKEWLYPPWWRADAGEASAESSAREVLEDLEQVQSRLREGIATVGQGQSWRPFEGIYWTPPRKGDPGRTGTHHQPPSWIIRQAEDGALVRIYSGLDTVDLIIAAAVDVLMRWWPQLRRCRRCQALFLPQHGRQSYHDATCSWRARYEKFKKKRDYDKEKLRRYERDEERERKIKGRK